MGCFVGTGVDLAAGVMLKGQADAPQRISEPASGPELPCLRHSVVTVDQPSAEF